MHFFSQDYVTTDTADCETADIGDETSRDDFEATDTNDLDIEDDGIRRFYTYDAASRDDTVDEHDGGQQRRG